jgi:hypothetical protein
MESHAWWRMNRSLAEIADELDRALKEKILFERLLNEACMDRERLNVRCQKADADLAAARTVHGSEVRALQAQLDQSLKKLQDADRGQGQRHAELAAKEKLIRDEFERNLQAVQVDFKQTRLKLEQLLERERKRFTEQIDRLEKQVSILKKQQSGCICRTVIEPPTGRMRDPDIDPWGVPDRGSKLPGRR